MGEVKFIEHKGIEILRIDLSHCEMEEIVPILNTAKKLISGRPLKSVLTLTNVSDARYTPALIRTMKEFVVHNKPFVGAGAVVGVEGILKVVFEAVIKFSGRALHLAADEGTAKDWLVQQKS
jgi:hypothetical protein